MSWIWGTLSYTAAVHVTESTQPQIHELYVTGIEQSLQLDGSMAQSRRYRQFYPRSHMPGDIVVSGICKDQEDYQRLAYFIRHNQWAILGSPQGNFQPQFKTNINRMLLLDIPTENNQWRGYVKSFGMTKKGVFDPAPTYNFNFVVIFDDLAENFGISSQIRRYYKHSDSSAGPTSDNNSTSSSGGSSGGQPKEAGKYQVGPAGEILRDIAKAIFGQASWWKEILKLNPSLDQNGDAEQLVPGNTTLDMPRRNSFR